MAIIARGNKLCLINCKLYYITFIARLKFVIFRQTTSQIIKTITNVDVLTLH